MSSRDYWSEKKKDKVDFSQSLLASSILSTGFGVASFYVGMNFTGEIPYTVPVSLFGIGAYSFYKWYKAHHPYWKVFKSLELTAADGVAVPLLRKKEDVDNGECYHFSLPAGLSWEDFKGRQKRLEEFRGCQIVVEQEYKGFKITELKPRKSTVYPYEYEKKELVVPIPVGYDESRKLQYIDLNDSATPHLGIFGTTGGGKSNVLRVAITNLILHNDCTDSIRFYLFDFKKCELSSFSRCKCVEEFCCEVSEAEYLFQDLCNEMESRYDLFSKEECSNITEYNKKHKKDKLKHIILVIDEFADLKDNKPCKKCIDKLGQKARGAGMHMIISSQRSDAKTIDSSIKTNLTTIIGLKCANEVSSRVILDDGCLAHLKEPGELVIKRGSELLHLKAPLLEKEDSTSLIKHTFIDKKPKNPVNDDVCSEEADIPWQ